MRVLPGNPGVVGVLAWVLWFAGCDGGYLETRPRAIGPAFISIQIPQEPAERPPVEFPHDRHTRALAKEGCTACHAVDVRNRLLPRLDWREVPENRDDMMEAYHDTCIGCHDQLTGPTDCGECHVHRLPTVSTRQAMAFDYSLHYRHVLAAGEACETCHHVYDRKLAKLVYKKRKESACRVCHGDEEREKRLSLRNASHVACINCHIQRQGKVGRTGPWLCAGCHSAEARARIETLDEVPRLDRGQPDLTWIKAPGATINVVTFNHLGHEPLVSNCSACHHRSVRSCKDCHALAPGPEGGGITLERAYHMNDSSLSCVGCHQDRSNRGDCAGCHHTLSQPPGESACKVCHNGPLPRNAEKAHPMIPMAPVELAGLPDVSEDFPEEVEIKVLANQYKPSRFPHKKIVARLDEIVRESKLATRFHGRMEVLCAGCHHNSPAGSRVPACRSCHGDAAHPTRDVPDLTEAYHRQCIGCHQQIGHKAQGCTDCHEEVSR